MRAPFREIKIADYARRRDPRAGLGRGVRPSPISTDRKAGDSLPPVAPNHRSSGATEDGLLLFS